MNVYQVELKYVGITIKKWHPNEGHGRFAGRPCTRWTDHLERFAGGDWMQIALDESKWDFFEEGFVTHKVIPS